MVLSTASLLTILLICNISIIAVWLFLKNHKRILQISVSTLLLGILLVLLRLLIPFEFSFQQTIGEKFIFPNLFALFYIPIIESYNNNIYLYHVFALIWILGIVLITLKTIIAYVKFKNLIDQESCINDEIIIRILRNVEHPYRKSTEFSVIRTSLVSVPLLFGIFRPKIILPKAELSDEELYYILRHEVTHYYHCDIWIKFLIELVSIIYWWNPLVHILKQEIDKILEIRVDMTVTKLFNEKDKIDYLECLLKIAKGNAPSRISSFSLAFDSRTASVLSQRFHIVLDNDFKQKSGIKSSALFIFIVFILTLTSLFVIEPYSIAPKDQQQTVELTTETAYLVINPDGGYDIYFNNEYFGTVAEIKDSYSNLPIYKNIKETQIHENQK